MIETKFWKPSGPGLSSRFRFASLKKDGSMSDTDMNGKINSNFNAKSLFKGLGVGSGIIFILLGAAALLLFLFIIKPSYALISGVNELKSDVNALKESVKNRDLVSLNESLNKTEKDLNSLRKSRESNFGWAKSFPLTKSYYSDSEHFINAGLHGVKAGRELSKTIEPFADAVGLRVSKEEKVVEQEGLMEAFQSWISVMPAVADNLDGVILELGEVGKELSYVDASKYPKEIKDVEIRLTIETSQKTLTKLNEYAPDIKKALTLIPSLLGVGTGEKRYAIIMQNNAEIRATGGFWTNYATFKLNNGLLSSDFSSKDMYSIDFILQPLDAIIDFPDVPPAYGKYLKVERMFARDANVSPDYPTAIQRFLYYYNLASRQAPWEVKQVDGFFAIDTNVIKELLQVTGPVTVNGVTYTSDNVVLELEKIASLSLQEQSGRKKVLGDLMEGMLQNVFKSDKNLWSKLIDKGIDLLGRKHVIAYLFDKDGQALLEKYNFAGSIVDPVAGDFSYVVSTNLGGDKTNLFVTKVVSHNFAKENGVLVDTVKLKYTYNKASEEYAPLIKVYRDWIRVYAPADSKLISLSGSEDTSLPGGDERGKTYFSGFITLAPYETKEVTFKYSIPGTSIKDNIYNLYIEKQPGIDTEKHTVTVNGKTQEFELKKDKKVSITL